MGATNKIRTMMRHSINESNKERLNNSNFSIISSNCVGGVIYHELGARFDSPTINLFFEPKDYIKFVKELRYYTCDCELTEDDTKNREYPVGKLSDVKIHFMHYHSFGEAKDKWIERCKRINWDNLFFVLTERDNCSEEILQEFERLPYKNKVVFTAKDREDMESAFHIHGTTQKDGEVMDLCSYKSKFTGLRWIDSFDYVDFLNRN